MPRPLAGRALVVDDDTEIRLMVSRILELEGFQVEGVRDGFEAIDKLKTADYDLILLDLMMPRVDGYGVIRFLEEERPSVLGHVVIMTALHPSGVEEKIARVLTKPFDVLKLIAYAREQSRPLPNPVPSRDSGATGSMEV